MSEDSETASPATPDPAAPRTPPTRGAPRRGGLATLLALVALLIAAAALWRTWTLGSSEARLETLRGELDPRLEALARGAEQRKRDLDGLRARLADADSVNRGVREELLGLGERSRHLEDAVANLAEQRQSGRDALARNEAEFLLLQAQERLALFHDAAAAIAAYRLADSALAAAEDPVFATVRQTIHAELAALEASKPLDTRATLARLERLRGELATLPPPRPATTAAGAPESRWQRLLAQFVHISQAGEGPLGGRDPALNRALVALDLREAELTLLARDPDGYRNALTRARTELAAAFDADAAPTRTALAELERLAATPLAPAIPELGSALQELRNLRITRALALPPAKPAAPAEPPGGSGT